jgi:SmpA / OmlA family
MKSQLSKLVLSIALSLGAIASTTAANAALTITPPGPGRLAAIHEGLTQEEVSRIAGSPFRVLAHATRDGDTQWSYSFTDDFGYTSEFDVNFGTDGKVENVSKERVDY